MKTQASLVAHKNAEAAIANALGKFRGTIKDKLDILEKLNLPSQEVKNEHIYSDLPADQSQ